MILRPVRPASAVGPPISKRPLGLTMILVAASTRPGGRTRSITSSRIPRSISSLVTFGSWWVEMTTASIRFGLPWSYSTVTCDLPSGRSQGRVPSLRASASRRVSLCASEMVSGISSGVSLQAKPIIIPWSPAPWSSKGSSSKSPERSSSEWSTPAAMSGDCSFR